MGDFIIFNEIPFFLPSKILANSGIGEKKEFILGVQY